MVSLFHRARKDAPVREERESTFVCVLNLFVQFADTAGERMRSMSASSVGESGTMSARDMPDEWPSVQRQLQEVIAQVLGNDQHYQAFISDPEGYIVHLPVSPRVKIVLYQMKEVLRMHRLVEPEMNWWSR